MTRILAALGCAVALAATAGCSDPRPDPLHAVTSLDRPGLALAVTGERLGVDTAVARAVARPLGAHDTADLSIDHKSPQDQVPAVEDHLASFAVGLDEIAPSRAGRVVRVGPYLTDSLHLASTHAIAGGTQLTGRRVCVVTGSSAERALAQLVPGSVPFPAASLPTCLDDVASGRASAVLDEGLALHAYLTLPPYSAVRLDPRALAPTRHDVLVAADRPDECRAVTAALRAFVDDGSWERAVAGDLVTTGVLDAVPARPRVTGCD